MRNQGTTVIFEGTKKTLLCPFPLSSFLFVFSAHKIFKFCHVMEAREGKVWRAIKHNWKLLTLTIKMPLKPPPIRW